MLRDTDAIQGCADMVRRFLRALVCSISFLVLRMIRDDILMDMHVGL